MAGVATTARLSARLANRYASRNVIRRGFQCSAPDRAAQNYTMPALSPTMTEGNIAAWRIKEGDAFAAGDVLLEIETDKATMDVEAQDDGVLVKIFEGDGAKAIAVGRRIAVTADAGDDVASVEIPAEEKSNSAAAGKGKETGAGEGKSGEVEQSPPKEETVETKGRGEKNAASQGSDAASGTSKASHAQPQKQKFQLSVAVETLLHQNGLSAADADNITATGPRGRLLKGDVLAHLGQISKEAPAKVQKHVEKQTHLDLSNIQLAKTSVEKPQQTPAPQSEAAAAAEPEQTVTELAIPISLSAVLATQKRVQDSLGIFLPLSTFIQRASELANDGLPASKTAKPTADDLFNAVLGLDKVPRASRGSFFPHISGVTPPARFAAPAAKSAKKQDIFDMLTAPKKKNSAAPRSPAGALGISPNAPNMFSVVAQSGEEKRAEEYLERMKIVLEQEPGRLVL